MIKKIILLAITLFILVIAVNAQNNPPQPNFHQFYGDVTGASPGDEVRATVAGNTFTTVVDSNNRYGYSPLFLVDGGNNGDTIIFYVKGVQAGTYPFEKGGVTELDLPSTQIPGGDGTGGGGAGGGGGGRGISPYYGINYTPGAQPTTPTTADGGGRLCFDDWLCDKWGPCINGIRNRQCIFNDDPTCVYPWLETPVMEEQCGPIPAPVVEATCYDGIQNQGEFGIDCGGPCQPCIIEQPVLIEKKTPWWIYSIAGLLVIGAIALTIIYFQRRHAFEPGKLVNGHLEAYIKQTLKSGFPESRIEDKLMQAGWKKKDVEKMMNKVKGDIKRERKF